VREEGIGRRDSPPPPAEFFCASHFQVLSSGTCIGFPFLNCSVMSGFIGIIRINSVHSIAYVRR
jgi:Ca2+/Na+ antiporter